MSIIRDQPIKPLYISKEVLKLYGLIGSLSECYATALSVQEKTEIATL
jgi:hypothetical protein